MRKRLRKKHRLREFVQVMTLDQVAAHFETSVSPLKQGCVAFGYDEDFGDSRLITVLLQDGRVSDRWLEKAAFSNEKCATVPHVSIPLKEYAHAGVC